MITGKEALVLLLAGGVGSRLNILVGHRAKPAVPFARHIPDHRFQLEQCHEFRV